MEERGGGGKPTFSALDHSLRYLDSQISHFVASPRPIWSDSSDSAAFLDAVDTLLATIHELDLSAIPANNPISHLADDLLQRAMLRLEDEFRSLLDQGNSPGGGSLSPSSHPYADSDGDDEAGEEEIPVAQPVEDYNIVIDALPWGTIADLKEMAKRMAAAGFVKEIAKAYSISRRDFLDESVSRLGLRPWSAEEVHRTPWAELEDEIKRWNQAVKVAFHILFPSERRLCDRIFPGLPPVADLSFAEVCRGTAVQLLVFADSVAAGSKAPERLFMIVDMYETIRDLLPEINTVFADQYLSFLRSDYAAVCASLGAAIRGIFTELENLIRRDPARSAPIPGGSVHPITRYVMNYLRAASSAWRTLEEVMEDEEAAAVGHLRPSSSLSVQISWILDLLHGNLDSKSKVYHDASLSSVFLMNNERYIIKKVEDSELKQLLGDDWTRRQAGRIRQWMGNYVRSTWGKVMAAVRVDDGLNWMVSVNGKLKLFNAYLEEIYSTQTGWAAVDEQMREEFRKAAMEAVVPAYRSFLGRVKAAGREWRQMERIVKYSPEEVEARIGELFGGARKRV